MPPIRINDKLSIDTGDSRGVTINYFAGSDTGVMDVFNVSLFFSSVKSMLECSTSTSSSPRIDSLILLP